MKQRYKNVGNVVVSYSKNFNVVSCVLGGGHIYWHVEKETTCLGDYKLYKTELNKNVIMYNWNNIWNYLYKLLGSRVEKELYQLERGNIDKVSCTSPNL